MLTGTNTEKHYSIQSGILILMFTLSYGQK